MGTMNLWRAFNLVPRAPKNLSEMTVLTTSRCNFRCRHCFMISELNKKSEELTADEMARMAPTMPKLRRVHLGGGEPFAKKDIAEKALVASNEWQSEYVCIPTNGWYTQNILDTIETFGKQARRQLRMHFSLNTLPEDMDAFTGKKHSFERWKESIEQAKELAARFDNVTILCLVTYNHDSKDVFAELKDYVVREVQPNDFSLQLARSHEHYQAEEDTESFDTVVSDYFRFESKQPWYLTAYRELIREYTSEFRKDPSRMPPCNSGTSRVVVTPSGDVYPCESRGYPNGNDYSQWCMGNIREYDYDIEALMHSPRARDIRRRMQERPCDCQHGIDIALNLLSRRRFQAQVLLRGLSHAIQRRGRGATG